MMTEPETMEEQRLPLDVPPRPFDGWREHTAKNWKSSAPDSYALALEMIREHGITCVSKLQQQLKELGVDKSRQTITALMRNEFTTDQLAELAAKNAQIAVLQGTSKLVDLIPDAKKSDMMAVSMSMKMAHDVERSLHGMPSEIKEVRQVSAEDRLQAARKVVEAKRLADRREGAVDVQVLPVGHVMADAEVCRPARQEAQPKESHAE
jgi:hypothetical protein